MIGFLKKELAMIKSNFAMLGIITIIYIILGFYDEMDVSFILPFICVMIMISSFSYDDNSKWDAYLITLPEGRKNSVKAKYLFTIILIFISSFLALILTFGFTYLKQENLEVLKNLATIFGSIFGTLFFLSIMYPLIYKMGIEKARVVIFFLVFGFIALGSILLKTLDLSFLDNVSLKTNYLIIGLIIFIIIMTFLSYLISLKIYSKKEY